MSKLKERVEEIQRRLAAGERGCDLAEEFGVSPSSISLIGHGKLYADPERPKAKPAPASAVSCIRHERWCCDCRWRFVQREYDTIPFRPMVRCASCAAALWARVSSRRSERILH